MRCLVLGATGYVGARLVPRLSADGHVVRCVVRSAEKLARTGFADRVEVVRGDVLDVVAEACADVDVVFHLVHSMDGPGFAERDREIARAVADAAADAGVRRIVYLGGLQPADGRNSAHLRSRGEVGEVLLAGPVPAVVLQAGIVVGRGSASFEMIRHIAESVFWGVGPSPLALPLPDQAWNRVQPIAVEDVLYWLTAALRLPAGVNRAFDVGGPDAPTYVELLRGYARVAGLARTPTVPVPVVAPRLGARAVGLLTPVDRALAAPLLESMAHELVCRDDDLAGLVGEPPGGRTPYAEAVRRALADPGTPSDLPGSGPPELVGEHVEEVDAPVEELWAVVAGIGGEAGWYTVPGVWELRQRLDGLVGGVGLRRGRPRLLTPGSALDWWRVEEVDPGRSLLLRAETRTPGVVRLRMTAEPTGPTSSRYTQTVTFRPRGLAGRVYWYAQKPAHDLVFGVTARMIALRAQARTE